MHLTDCFIDLVAYVAYFRKSVAVKQPPYDGQGGYPRLLAQGERLS
jgi:hypothetical protein